MESETKNPAVRVYERVVRVYDMVINGKIYRWDDPASARRFAAMNRRNRIRVIKIPAKYEREAAKLVDRTTPNALVRKSIKRMQVRNLPHEVAPS